MYVIVSGVEDDQNTSGAASDVPTRTKRARFLSPGYVTMAAGVGHGLWGLLAYRSPLRKIIRAGYIDSVGDGLFRTEHSQDDRAAAYWFMFVSPIVTLLGYLVEQAIHTQDRRAVTAAGASITAVMAVGGAAVPRSGFLLFSPLGPWMLYRGLHLAGRRIDPAVISDGGPDGDA